MWFCKAVNGVKAVWFTCNVRHLSCLKTEITKSAQCNKWTIKKKYVKNHLTTKLTVVKHIRTQETSCCQTVGQKPVYVCKCDGGWIKKPQLWCFGSSRFVEASLHPLQPNLTLETYDINNDQNLCLFEVSQWHNLTRFSFLRFACVACLAAHNFYKPITPRGNCDCDCV